VKYEDVTFLREHSSAWRLLRADNAPLVLSFLHRVFVEGNARSVSASELAGQLDDDLYALNDRLGAGTYPKPAHEYLNDWARPEVGWLRKYYPAGSDEPHFDATPAVEKALSWLRTLEARSFIGTESRLNTLFELLRQIAYGADDDPEVRLAELRWRRQEIDVEIAEVERGNMASSTRPLNATATSSSPTRPAGCSPTSARSRPTSGLSTGSCASGSRAGPAPRASCSTRCSAIATPSRSPTKGAASRRSTTSCCRRSDRLS